MATNYELEVLAKYSTPGLRSHELSRFAKENQLHSQRVGTQDIKEICDKLYGEETISEAQAKTTG